MLPPHAADFGAIHPPMEFLFYASTLTYDRSLIQKYVRLTAIRVPLGLVATATGTCGSRAPHKNCHSSSTPRPAPPYIAFPRKKPKGESSRENSPPSHPNFRRSGVRRPVYNFALPKPPRIRERSPHIPCPSVPACHTSFLSACCLRLPEVSLVADPLAGFDSALFSERFLFR